MLTLLTLLTTLAFADDAPAEEPAPDEAAAEGAAGDAAVTEAELPLREPPEVKSRVFPTYPDSARAERISTECKAEVVMDETGKATSVEATGCPEPFVEATETAVAKWRWKPAKADGEAVPARFILHVKYRMTGMEEQLSPEQMQAILDAHTDLTDPADHCVVTLTAHTSGDLSGLASSDKPLCLVVPSLVPMPGKLAKLDSDVACTARFDVVAGAAQGLEVTGCDGAAAKWATRAMRAYRYNHGDAATPYEVRLTITPGA